MITLEQMQTVQAAVVRLCEPSGEWVGASLGVALERETGLPGTIVNPVLRMLGDMGVLSRAVSVRGRPASSQPGFRTPMKRWTLLLPEAEVKYVQPGPGVGYFALQDPSDIIL